MGAHGNFVLDCSRGTLFVAVPSLATGVCPSWWIRVVPVLWGEWSVFIGHIGRNDRGLRPLGPSSPGSTVTPPLRIHCAPPLSEGAILRLLLLFSSHRRNFKGKLLYFPAVGFVFSGLTMLWGRSRRRHVRAFAAENSTRYRGRWAPALDQR